jgi:hypothetical protein
MPDEARIRSALHARDLQHTLLQAIKLRKGGAPAEDAALCRRYLSQQPHHSVLPGQRGELLI